MVIEKRGKKWIHIIVNIIILLFHTNIALDFDQTKKQYFFRTELDFYIQISEYMRTGKNGKCLQNLDECVKTFQSYKWLWVFPES